MTDDLPTPPLPEETSSTRVGQSGSAKRMARPSAWPWAAWLPAVEAGSPWISSRTAARSSSVITVKSMSARSMPSRASAASVTRLVISARSGHPATVSATCTATVPPSMATPLTMPRSTMLRCSSGSSTGRSASMTSASVTGNVDLSWRQGTDRG